MTITKILYLGDIHGKVNTLSSTVQRLEEEGEVSAIIQVGDFGIGFPGWCMERWAKKRAEKRDWTVPIYTCLGNHDNWDFYLKRMIDLEFPESFEFVEGSGIHIVKRGGLINIGGEKHLFIGGALSIDRHVRVDDVSWWKNEEPSREEFEYFFEVLEAEKPGTIVSHEVPLRVPIYRAGRKSNTTTKMLDNVIKHASHRPERWYTGHHHILKRWKIDKIKFFCCGLHGEGWERDIRREE